jgi:hypothetical protein
MATDTTFRVEWACDAQQQAVEYGPYPLCLSGGFGSGKTFAACLKGLALSTWYPGNRGLIYRQVALELRRTTLATLGKILPRSHCRRWNEVDGVIELENGSEILAMHMDNPDIETVIKGLEINWFVGDQAEDTAEEIFDRLRSRLGRWDKALVPPTILEAHARRTGEPWPWVHPTTGQPIPPTYAVVTCNPDTDLHWLYARFHPESVEWQEKWHRLGYKMLFFDSTDNKFLTDQNKAELLAQDPEFVRRYVRGLWGIPEGVIHTIPPESIIEFDRYEEGEAFLAGLRQSCTLYRVLDHGESSPTCCAWFAVDRNGNVIVYREYYMPNKLVSYHREQITALSEGETYTWHLADPSIFNKGTGGQKHGQFWSVSDEYSDRVGLPSATAINWAPADHNELGTRNRINEYLSVDPARVHPFTQALGAPRLFFVKRSDAYPQGCVHTIRETRAQRRKCLGTISGRKTFSDERDPTIIDHGYDVVRYAIASRPPTSKEPSRKAGAKTFFGKQRDLAKRLAHARR